ncbi:energy transducer TonB [Sphingomicrobium sp. XHP0235]|uniref:energy transducer TonB n=1 Tax=Sphingomicrobium aquimarinum TaxID=3133971 RepID=UPI0031FEE7EF
MAMAFSEPVLAQEVIAVPARPIQPTAIIGSEDYPAEALRNKGVGSVRVLVDVNAKGGVSDCTVMQSSGSRSLDRMTCAETRRNARFHPALDSSGRAVTSTYLMPTITFAIPGKIPEPKKTILNETLFPEQLEPMEIWLDVAERGGVERCTAVVGGLLRECAPWQRWVEAVEIEGTASEMADKALVITFAIERNTTLNAFMETAEERWSARGNGLTLAYIDNGSFMGCAGRAPTSIDGNSVAMGMAAVSCPHTVEDGKPNLRLPPPGAERTVIYRVVHDRPLSEWPGTEGQAVQ